MIRLALAAIMLLAPDIAAAQNARLSPNAQSAIAGMVGIRAVTATTATYGAYTAPANDIAVLLYTFPANCLAPGNQIRVRAFGTVTNTSGAPLTFLPSIRITQKSQSDAIAAIREVPSAANVVAWELDGVLTVSSPGGNSAIEPYAGNTGAVNTKGSPPTLVVGGMLRMTLTDTGATSATVAGGNWLVAPTADTESFLIATIDPNANLSLDSGVQTGVSLTITSDADFTVQGGWMEAL